MKPMQDIKNYILIHNGEIITKKITEDITISESFIKINQATNLQIVYQADKEEVYKIQISIASPILDLVETFVSNSNVTYQTNIVIEQDAQVTRYVSQDTNETFKVAINDSVEVAKNGYIRCAYVDFSNSNSAVVCQYDLVGEHAQAKLRLAALSKQKEMKKFEVHIRHLAPHTTGSMDNYGVVKDAATLHIDGIGTIKQGNYQSNNQQINKILVFNSKCVAIANPYLYIDEYDVNAGHGASVGKVDEEQLYYLQSRGLSKEEALHLITYGYFIPVLEFINNEEVKEQYNQLLKEKVGI